MFTYKFEGLAASDAPTPYTYGSLPAKPELGHIIVYEESGTRYAVIRIEGEGLLDDGDGSANQRELAWAEIGQGKTVPTVWLQKLATNETPARGRSFSYEEVKEFSQKNRETRLSSARPPEAIWVCEHLDTDLPDHSFKLESGRLPAQVPRDATVVQLCEECRETYMQAGSQDGPLTQYLPVPKARRKAAN